MSVLRDTEFRGKANQTNLTVSKQDIFGNNFAPSSDPSSVSKQSSIKQNYSVTERLRELNSLRKDGVVTEMDFQKKKKELLKEF